MNRNLALAGTMTSGFKKVPNLNTETQAVKVRRQKQGTTEELITRRCLSCVKTLERRIAKLNSKRSIDTEQIVSSVIERWKRIRRKEPEIVTIEVWDPIEGWYVNFDVLADEALPLTVAYMT